MTAELGKISLSKLGEHTSQTSSLMPQTSFLSRFRHVLFYYVPAVVAPLGAYVLRISDTSSVWGFRTAVLVTILRAIFNDPTPKSMLEEQRQSFVVNAPTPDTLWVVEDILPAPKENNLLEVVSEVVKELATDAVALPQTTVVPVSGEWIGSRREPGHGFGRTETNKEQNLRNLKADTTSDFVFIFLHGGQF